MLKTNISQRVAVVALLIVSTFAVAGLTAVTVLSDSIAVAQGLGNDPIAGCIKTVGETWVGNTVGDKQNWNESRQNFVSLLTTDNTIKLMNQNIVHNGFPEDPAKPITDTAGIWSMLNNGNMTQYDRFHLFYNEVNHNLADARPGFTHVQQIALSRCITTEVNSLGRTSHF
ncbi:MAG: hypothetical protein FIO04_04055 [Nitrosopumilales archaeon]|nr:hypothetical protein [Nitrosopumilales archaeon]